jgi:hypothetical protein
LVEAYFKWPEQYGKLVRGRPKKQRKRGKDSEDRKWQQSLENTRKMFEAMKNRDVSAFPFKL